jgi:uncharacterized protein (DUF433 family)
MTAAEEQIDHHERITIDPAVMKPVIKGTRIPVARVIAHLAHNPDLIDLFGAYPELTVEDAMASLQNTVTAPGGELRQLTNANRSDRRLFWRCDHHGKEDRGFRGAPHLRQGSTGRRAGR